MDIETGEGRKRVGITRIHIEEDAGKLIHQEGKGTLIDYNRCGVPLIEIVSEPDFRSVEEIKAYLQKLRATILYTGVSDCKMNEGSLRVDVNLSVRKRRKTLGTRTEMKNLNSFQFIARAVEYEFRRQVEALEAGEKSFRRLGASTKPLERLSPCGGRKTRTITGIFRIPICRRLRYPRIFCGNSRPRSPCCRIREKGVCKAVWPD